MEELEKNNNQEVTPNTIFKKGITLLVFFLMMTLVANAVPEKNTFPWQIRTNEETQLRSGPGTDFDVITTIPKGKTLISIKRSPFKEWVKVEYNGRKGYLYTRRITFVKSLSSTQEGKRLAEEKTERNNLVWWCIGISAFILLSILAAIFGRRGVKDIGIWILSIIISILASVIYGILPPLLVFNELSWWIIVIAFVVLLIGAGLAIFLFHTNKESTLAYVLSHQVVKMGGPAIVTVLFALLAMWMESWKVDTFWGGVGIFFMAAIGVIIAAVHFKIGKSLIISLDGINIINGLVFIYLSILQFTTIFNACEELCSVAAWLAIFGLIPGGYVAKSDPYPLDINGHRAKETSFGNYVDTAGNRYQDVGNGYGKDTVRKY